MVKWSAFVKTMIKPQLQILGGIRQTNVDGVMGII